jgi:hypothetical protein
MPGPFSGDPGATRTRKRRWQPQGILVGLNKTMSLFYVDLNGESPGRSGDEIRKGIFEYANRYDC